MGAVSNGPTIGVPHFVQNARLPVSVFPQVLQNLGAGVGVKGGTVPECGCSKMIVSVLIVVG